LKTKMNIIIIVSKILKYKTAGRLAEKNEQ